MKIKFCAEGNNTRIRIDFRVKFISNNRTRKSVLQISISAILSVHNYWNHFRI